jgi:ABC-type sulfate transport system permease subunit
VIPLAVLIKTSWVEGRDRLADVVGSPAFRSAVVHSLELSAAATLLAVPVGVAIALALRDRQLPGRAFWRAAVLLPLALIAAIGELVPNLGPIIAGIIQGNVRQSPYVNMDAALRRRPRSGARR